MRGSLHGRVALVALVALVASAVLSASLLLLHRERPVARVLFFGSVEGKPLVGEVRYLPRRADPSEDLQLLVDELILGPRSREKRSALPRSTEVRSLMLGGTNLYLDLSSAALLDDLGNGLQGAERLHALALTLRFNHRWLRQVHLFVDGQVPRYDLLWQGRGWACC